MTIDPNALGRRVAKYRKIADYATARNLAEAINNPRITTAVIQNIESGRKPDIAVSELLDISYALGISPIFLLAPLTERPWDPLDLPNLSDGLSKITGVELDAWIATAGNLKIGFAARDLETAILRVEWTLIRKLFSLVEVWRDQVLFSDPVEDREENERQIDALFVRLSHSLNYHWLDWLERPWVGETNGIDHGV